MSACIITVYRITNTLTHSAIILLLDNRSFDLMYIIVCSEENIFHEN